VSYSNVMMTDHFPSLGSIVVASSSVKHSERRVSEYGSQSQTRFRMEYKSEREDGRKEEKFLFHSVS